MPIRYSFLTLCTSWLIRLAAWLNRPFRCKFSRHRDAARLYTVFEHGSMYAECPDCGWRSPGIHVSHHVRVDTLQLAGTSHMSIGCGR